MQGNNQLPTKQNNAQVKLSSVNKFDGSEILKGCCSQGCCKGGVPTR